MYQCNEIMTKSVILLTIFGLCHSALHVRMNDARTGQILTFKWPENSPFTVTKPLHSVSPFLLGLLKHKLKSKVVVQKITTTLAPPDCYCVPYYQCDANNTIINDGVGIIDVRIRRCTGDLEVCCKPPKPKLPTTMPPLTTAPPTTVPMTPSTMPPGTSPSSSVSPIITTVPTTPSSPPTPPPASPPTPPSTSPPTSPPTSLPTTPPTSPPTSPPASPPTSLPTSPPTSPPTPPPTSPPTPSPTSSPTSPPSSPPTTATPADCICVPTYLCDADGYIITNGEGIINPRLTAQQNALCGTDQVCCKLQDGNVQFPTSLLISSPSITATTGTRPITSSPALPTTAMSVAITTIPPPPPTTVVTSAPPLPPSSIMTTAMPTELTSALPISTLPAQVSNVCAGICVLPTECDANGYVIVSGSGTINPRYPGGFRQTEDIYVCKLNEVCCKLPPNKQDDEVIFPDELPATTIGGIDPRANLTSEIKNSGTPNECRCVKSTSCSVGNEVQLDAADNIDPRFRLCTPTDEVCCRLSGVTGSIGSTGGTTAAPQRSPVINRDSFPTTTQMPEPVCGVSGPPCSPEECPKEEGAAYFAEFPWMVVLLLRQSNGQSVFMCGGSLINPRAVLTAAHCVLNRQKGIMVARFGEYDTKRIDEPLPFQESEIQAVVTHPQYYSAGLYNDIAVLVLETPIIYAGNVMPICLPEKTNIFNPGTECVASGWGKNAFGGEYQKVLQKIILPIVERKECQLRLQKTRLGQFFQLHSSFMCAGGEESKDTCTGDGGGPLVCQTPSGEYVQVGIVSWGIGCGEESTPAVYVDVAQFKQWIDQQLINYGVL